MTAGIQIQLKETQHTAFINFYKAIQTAQKEFRSSTRASMLNIDKAYQREQDRTNEHQRAQNANRLGDPNKYQNQTVPVVKPQVETAVGYQSEVFLTGVPMFPVVADPENIDTALQLETIIDNHAVRGGWTRQLMLSFRDGAKYNFAPMDISWTQEVVHSVVTDVSFSATQGKPTEVIWAGNTLERIDPYNAIIDSNVHPSEVYKHGDYAGYTKIMSRIRLKSLLASFPDKQTRDVKAFESRVGIITTDATSENFYVPPINESKKRLDSGGFNWFRWAELEIKGTIEYKNHYEVTFLYARILPSEFKLNVPSANTPQIWKLVIVNHSIIVYCERVTNAHGYIPVLVGQPNEDGLMYQTKSTAEDAEPFQQVATALMNSIIQSRKRAISDRVLYDPTRVAAAQINSANPSAKIPVKPAGYGKKISDSVYAFPYREEAAFNGMQQVKESISLSEQLAGQNPARQGQFIKGNRTRQEFSDTMGNAISRDKMTSILYEAQLFQPLKYIIKINIMQHQTAESLVSREKKRNVQIDPVELRKAVLEFKLADGLIPSSTVMNSDTFSVALQQMGASPALGAGYNITPMFSYLMKSQGADLQPFEKSPEQIAFEQAMDQWTVLLRYAIDKGLDPATADQVLPPRPLPEEFNYNPNPNPQTPQSQVLPNETS